MQGVGYANAVDINISSIVSDWQRVNEVAVEGFVVGRDIRRVDRTHLLRRCGCTFMGDWFGDRVGDVVGWTVGTFVGN